MGVGLCGGRKVQIKEYRTWRQKHRSVFKEEKKSIIKNKKHTRKEKWRRLGGKTFPGRSSRDQVEK